MNNRQQMVTSNQQAIKWLLANKYDHIHLKPHTRYPDIVYTQDGKYEVHDHFNLWDGFCLNKYDRLEWVQIKTGKWPPVKPIREFVKKTHANCLAIKVSKPSKKGRKYSVAVRQWMHGTSGDIILEVRLA